MTISLLLMLCLDFQLLKGTIAMKPTKKWNANWTQNLNAVR
jgi:hypothetical protein